MTKPAEKELIQALMTIIRSDDARQRQQQLNEVQLRQVTEAEQLLGGLSGSRVVDAVLAMRRLGMGGSN